MRRAAVLLLVAIGIASCATPIVYWDLTGRGRGSDEFQTSTGRCQIYASQKASEANKAACYGCASLTVATVLLAQQNAFKSCMLAEGWGP
jgi:hypothetical protein